MADSSLTLSGEGPVAGPVNTAAFGGSMSQEEALQKAAADFGFNADAIRVTAKVDVSTMFSGKALDARGPSWVAYGPDGQPSFPELLPAVLGFTGVNNNGRSARRDQDNAQIMVDTSANPSAWDTAFTGAGLIHGGNNLLEADTPANRRAILESWRAMAALMSASARIEQTGWTFRSNANGDNWVTDSDQPYASGGTATIGFHHGLQVDIPVPAGTSYLLCHGTDVTAARGATLHITQGGVAVASKSLDGLTVMTPWEASNGVAPVVIRLPNLKAGTVTVTVDHAGLTGQVLAIIDALLPQSLTPRTIFGVKPVTLNAPTHDKPDLFAYYRTVPDTVRAEIGTHFLSVDPQPAWKPATMLGPDGLHPTVAGTIEHRDAIVTAARSTVRSKVAPSNTQPAAGPVNTSAFGGTLTREQAVLRAAADLGVPPEVFRH